MVKLVFDARVSDALARAEYDPQGAADALLVAAEYMRAGQALPDNLARFMADAIDGSMRKPRELRAKYLLSELKLTVGNRPAAGDWLEIGATFDDLIESGISQNAASDQVAADFNISQSTAVRMWKKYTAAMIADRNIK